MSGVPSSELKRYFVEARRWDQDRLASALRSRRLAWSAAALATGLAVISTGAVALLTPLKSTEPFVIRVDQATGAVDVMRGLSAEGGRAARDTVGSHSMANQIAPAARLDAPTMPAAPRRRRRQLGRACSVAGSASTVSGQQWV